MIGELLFEVALVTMEKDHKNELERLMEDHETELLRLKQENFVLSAKVGSW
jgi:hypothetical protein